MKTCKQCGAEMFSDSPEGLCARCLVSVAMKEPSESPPAPAPASQAGGQPAVAIIDIADAAEVAARLPQFKILELLGRGGMGVVYKACQLNLDRIVALKILPPADALSPDFVERFRREARSLAKLNHPNIVHVHDFGETGGLYYFVMEFVDGVNLRDMIRTGKMKPEEALAVVPKICDALQFAHEEGVVHRDVKPENILMDKRGRVKIADFGLAKLLRREHTDHTLTMTGMTLGTPRYMAPEQLDKPETVDHRADIYSLGVVFYEMLTGEVPMGRFAPPSEKVQIDVRLDEIVLHALERDADRRYQHVSEVRDDVEKVTSKPQVAPVPLSPPSAAMPIPHSSADEEGGEAEHSIFAAWGGRIIALIAVLLAFFNPWGATAWYFFAAACAIFGVLMAFGIGRRRTVRSQVLDGEKAGQKLRAEIQARGVEVLVAGIALAVTGLIGCIYGGAVAFSFFENHDLNAAPRAALGGAFCLALFLCGIAALNGGIAMRKMRFHTFTLIISILLIALLPGALLVGRPRSMEAVFFQLAFGLYAGIRAFLLLRKPEVETVFAANANQSAWPTTQPPAIGTQPRLSKLAVISAVWALMGLVCGLAIFLFWLMANNR